MIQFLDGFCGAGGASLGITRAGCKVSVAVNHDERAIWAHNANHPETHHLNTDIRAVDVEELARSWKLDCIWWSAECTHFSNAKGGASRDADSRMLSEELIRYTTALDPDWIFVENVREFLSWGPLLPKRKAGAKTVKEDRKKEERRYVRIQVEMFDAVALGDKEAKARLEAEMDLLYFSFQQAGLYDMDLEGKVTMLPDPASKGLLYLRWVQAIKDLGYDYDYKMLNSADFGAYQSRNRYFGVFVRKSMNIHIEFPRPTHSKVVKDNSLFGNCLKPWEACRNILDLDDKGESLLHGRKGRKPLVAASCARIAYGMNKFKGDGVLIDRSNTGASPTNADTAMPTVRASFQNGVVHVATVDSCTFGQDEISVDSTMPTVMAKRDKYLMQAFVVPTSFSNAPLSMNGPLPTLVAARKHSYLCSPFIVQQYSSDGNPNQVSSASAPLWAVTCSSKAGIVVPFLSKYHGNGDNATSIDTTCSTITTKDRLGIAQCDFMVYKQGTGAENSDRRVSDHNTTINTIKTCFIPTTINCTFLNYSYGGHNSAQHVTSVDKPSNTICTGFNPQMVMAIVVPTDDSWPLLFQHAPKPTKRGNIIVPAWTRVINGYQVDNRIVDIHYRMLKVSELKLAQGFPQDYILDKTSETVAKKHIGNAVHVECAYQLVNVNCGPESAYATRYRNLQASA